MGVAALPVAVADASTIRSRRASGTASGSRTNGCIRTRQTASRSTHRACSAATSIRALSYEADLAPWPRNVGANRITVRPTVSGKAAATAASEASRCSGSNIGSTRGTPVATTCDSGMPNASA